MKAGDGNTLLVPDTPQNQQAWPQPQKPGLGFPILRLVALFSLATAAVCGVAIGPYKGKGTGEPALLRELFDRFAAGDVFLGNCYFCSYFLLALVKEVLAHCLIHVSHPSPGRQIPAIAARRENAFCHNPTKVVLAAAHELQRRSVRDCLLAESGLLAR